MTRVVSSVNGGYFLVRGSLNAAKVAPATAGEAAIRLDRNVIDIPDSVLNGIVTF